MATADLSWATSAAKARAIPDGVAVGFHQCDRLGRFAREIVAAIGERRGRPLLQVGDALERRLEALAFRLVLRDRDRERALGAFGRGSSIADLLVENEQSVAVGEIFLRLGRRSADHVVMVLNMVGLHCYEQLREHCS